VCAGNMMAGPRSQSRGHGLAQADGITSKGTLPSGITVQELKQITALRMAQLCQPPSLPHASHQTSRPTGLSQEDMPARRAAPSLPGLSRTHPLVSQAATLSRASHSRTTVSLKGVSTHDLVQQSPGGSMGGNEKALESREGPSTRSCHTGYGTPLGLRNESKRESDNREKPVSIVSCGTDRACLDLSLGCRLDKKTAGCSTSTPWEAGASGSGQLSTSPSSLESDAQSLSSTNRGTSPGLASSRGGGNSSIPTSSLPHSLTVQELKELTRMRLAREAGIVTLPGTMEGGADTRLSPEEGRCQYAPKHGQGPRITRQPTHPHRCRGSSPSTSSTPASPMNSPMVSRPPSPQLYSMKGQSSESSTEETATQSSLPTSAVAPSPIPCGGAPLSSSCPASSPFSFPGVPKCANPPGTRDSVPTMGLRDQERRPELDSEGQGGEQSVGEAEWEGANGGLEKQEARVVASPGREMKSEGTKCRRPVATQREAWVVSDYAEAPTSSLPPHSPSYDPPSRELPAFSFGAPPLSRATLGLGTSLGMRVMVPSPRTMAMGAHVRGSSDDLCMPSLRQRSISSTSSSAEMEDLPREVAEYVLLTPKSPGSPLMANALSIPGNSGQYGSAASAGASRPVLTLLPPHLQHPHQKRVAAVGEGVGGDVAGSEGKSDGKALDVQMRRIRSSERLLQLKEEVEEAMRRKAWGSGGKRQGPGWQGQTDKRHEALASGPGESREERVGNTVLTPGCGSENGVDRALASKTPALTEGKRNIPSGLLHPSLPSKGFYSPATTGEADSSFDQMDMAYDGSVSGNIPFQSARQACRRNFCWQPPLQQPRHDIVYIDEFEQQLQPPLQTAQASK